MNADLVQESLERRRKLVDGQLRPGGVNALDVLNAFLAAPREDFAVAPSLALAYSDGSLKSRANGRGMLTPLTLARLLQAADIRPSEKVLDVGGGGYAAALASELGGQVVALEASSAAAEAVSRALGGRWRVETRAGALKDGVQDLAPFDVIFLNGAFASEPTALVAQLSSNGRLLGIRKGADGGHAVLIERPAKNGLSERVLFEAAAETLEGFERAELFAF